MTEREPLKQPVFQELPEKRDKKFEIILRFYLSLYFFRPGVSREFRHFLYRELVPSILTGQKRSIGEDARFLLEPFHKEITGVSNIPGSGPLLVIANHWKKGPYRNYWTHFLLSEIVDENRDVGGNIKWIMQDARLFPGTARRVPFSAKVATGFANIYDLLTVTPPRIRENGLTSSSLKEAKSIIASLAQDNVWGLYPELKNSTRLYPGHYLAGELAYGLLMTRQDSVVCPTGVWSEERNGHEILQANFGKAFPLSDILMFGKKPKDPDGKKEFYGNIADYLVATISPLMPERYRLRTYAKDKAA